MRVPITGTLAPTIAAPEGVEAPETVTGEDEAAVAGLLVEAAAPETVPEAAADEPVPGEAPLPPTLRMRGTSFPVISTSLPLSSGCQLESRSS